MALLLVGCFLVVSSAEAASFGMLTAGSAPSSAPTSEAATVDELSNPQKKLTPEAINALVATLDDAAVRQLLLDQLRAGAAPASASAVNPASMVADGAALATTIQTNLRQVAGAVVQVPGLLATTALALTTDGPATIWLRIALALVLIFGAGVLAERLYRRRLSGVPQQLSDAAAGPYAFGARFGYFGYELGALLVFLAAVGLAHLLLHQGHTAARSLFLALVAAFVIVRAVQIAGHVVLAPNYGRLRLLHFNDEDAGRAQSVLVRSAAILAFGLLGCGLIAHLAGGGPAHVLLVWVVSLAFAVYFAAGIYRLRSAIAGDLADYPGAPIWRQAMARAWPYLLIAILFGLLVLSWLLDLAQLQIDRLPGLATLVLLLVVPHIDAALARAAAGKSTDDKSLDRKFWDVGVRALRILIVFLSLRFLADLWAVDLQGMAAAGVGDRFADAAIDLGMIALLAFVLWQATGILIDRKRAAEAGPVTAGEAGDAGGTGATRLATLLPLFKISLQGSIVVIAVLMGLSSVGVNIAPLLAGAGVIGIAVGFGAQTLVRDVVSGMFFLIDDAFRTGEYIDVGQVKGTVEKISVRSLRLRHHRGALHTIPFGEIHHLTNYSRDWVIMKLEFRVPFTTDLDRVRKIFKRIGQDLLKNPDVGPDFIEPFKSQGVYTLDDSAFVIRGKFMAKPGKQFMAKREIYNAVQDAFKEAGITFADRRVTVQVADTTNLSEEAKEEIAEGAAASLRAQDSRTAAAT